MMKVLWMNMELRKSNLIFLTTTLADLLYIVKEIEGEKVVAKKLDSPPGQWEELPLSKVTKLAEEQELLLPQDFREAIEKQREVTFTPPRQGRAKRPTKKLFDGIPDKAIEEILAVLSHAGEEGE